LTLFGIALAGLGVIRRRRKSAQRYRAEHRSRIRAAHSYCGWRGPSRTGGVQCSSQASSKRQPLNRLLTTNGGLARFLLREGPGILRSDLQIEHSLQLELAGTAQLTVRNHSMPNSTGPPWDSAAGHFDRMKALRAWFQQTPRIHPKPLACAYQAQSRRRRRSSPRPRSPLG
jgi:hypothetical protein